MLFSRDSLDAVSPIIEIIESQYSCHHRNEIVLKSNEKIKKLKFNKEYISENDVVKLRSLTENELDINT